MHFGAHLIEKYHWFPSQFCAPFPKNRDKQRTITLIYRRPNFTKFDHNTSISVAMKTFGTEFWKFYHNGSFFQKIEKNTKTFLTSCDFSTRRHNFAMITDRRKFCNVPFCTRCCWSKHVSSNQLAWAPKIVPEHDISRASLWVRWGSSPDHPNVYLIDMKWEKYWVIKFDVWCAIYDRRCSMCDVRCSMSDVWCLMCDVWCLMSDVWCMVYDVWCAMYDVWWAKFDVWRMMFDVWYSMYDVWCMIGDVRCLMYDVRCAMFGVRCMMCDVWCMIYDHYFTAFPALIYSNDLQPYVIPWNSSQSSHWSTILRFGRRVIEVPFSGSDIAVRFLLSVIFNKANSENLLL